jgi:hypothetical protein
LDDRIICINCSSGLLLEIALISTIEYKIVVDDDDRSCVYELSPYYICFSFSIYPLRIPYSKYLGTFTVRRARTPTAMTRENGRGSSFFALSFLSFKQI